MKKWKENKGITLIALVITIIVLLILAGISIATLAGENGLLTKADTAKTETSIASAKEKVQVAVMGSYDENGEIHNSELKTNLENVEGIDKTTIPATITDSSFSITVTVDGHEVTIEKNGKVTIKGDNTTLTVEEAKNKGSMLDENKPTTITDTYGNCVKVPEGFKIAEDSAIDVTGGVVIEDATDGVTKGSQFVWIPVGKVYTSNDKSTFETITLGRYIFDGNGTVNTELSKTEPGDQIKITSSNTDYYREALKDEITTNTHAKDIELFRITATTNGGYYIGRYEARVAGDTQRTVETDDNGLQKVTVKGSDYVYNYVTQLQAAKLSREMYDDESTTFTSDLVNSYAWDTAIVFIQRFGQRDYSRQKSLNASFAEKGTNDASSTVKDKQLNIWDMASNDMEWITETYSYSYIPCVYRGGKYGLSDIYTSYRDNYNTRFTYEYFSFRIALYMKN